MRDWKTLLTLALFLALAPVALAADEATVDGTVSVGFHATSTSDSPSTVAEYDDHEDDIRPEAELDLLAHSEAGSCMLVIDFEDESTHSAKADLRLGPYFKNDFCYTTFFHRSDADMLDNLTVRELEDPETGAPGGKMNTHELTFGDEDVFGVQVRNLRNVMELALPFAPNTKLHASYRNMAREGFRQANSISHCATCHVVGRRVAVDEQTEETGFGLSTEIGWFKAAYNFTASEFENNAPTPMGTWDLAQHPVNGENIEEFGSRVIYNDETLEYSKIPDTDQTAHQIKVEADLGTKQQIVASYIDQVLENLDTDNELATTYGSARYSLMASKKFSLGAAFARRELENDDVFVDLPNWREGRSGGGQNFDFTRESTYDRVETQGRLNARFRASAMHRFGFDYRYRSIDRDNFELGYDDMTTETVEHEVRLSWDFRMASKLRARLSGEFEMVDYPFLNPRGVNERAVGNDPTLPDNSSFYYFQRERVGEATNQPTSTHRGTANLTYTISPKAGLNLQAMYEGGTNDELNTYDYEESTMVATASLNLVPSDQTIFTIGATHFTMTSTALFSVPVMDG